MALDIQRQSLVLLKNSNNLLPLDKSKIKRILVTGHLAVETDYAISRYGPTSLNVTSVLEEINEYLNNKVKVSYSKDCEVVDSSWPESEIIPTLLTICEKKSITLVVEQVKKSDVIIAVMGEDEKITGESKSRTGLDLPGRQQNLLEALYTTGKPVILILINGG